MAELLAALTKGKGVKLKMLKEDGETTDKFLANLNSISGLGIESSEEEATCLEDEGKYFLPGDVEAKDVNFGGLLRSDESIEQFTDLWALAKSRKVRDFVVVFPTGMEVPFTGFVKAFSTGDITPDGQNTFEGTIKVNGIPDPTIKE